MSLTFFLQLYSLTEENIELKKHGHQQDEKLKRLATKILRLKSDMKKLGVGKLRHINIIII